MSSETLTFQPIPRRTVHELIDGEVILIQFDRGYYFSLRGSGAAIWELIVAGASVKQIGAALEDAGAGDAAAGELGALIDQLLENDLIEAADSEPPSNPPVLPDGFSYQRPTLERYDDMKDFLMLDPIHEVAEAGWPESATHS